MQGTQQLTMFGVPANPEITFNIYHDESGTYVPGAGDRWLLHGVLFVPAVKQTQAFSALQAVRAEVGYYEQVHYVKLRKSLMGPKAQCCAKWLHLYVGQFSEFCFYHCLAIHTSSPGFQHGRFHKPHHAYNRFARMAIEGAIAWSLKPFQRVALKFHSHDKCRQEEDNFATYMPREVCKSIHAKRTQKPADYPEIRLLHPEVISVVTDPTRSPSEMQQECELTQLVDLMTSNTAQAITASSGQRAKIALAEVVTKWIEDTRKPPWLQTEELHRRFSVSCFPDEREQFHNPTLAVTTRHQLPLFEDLQEE